MRTHTLTASLDVVPQTNLFDFDRQGIERFFESRGYKAFHGRNVLKWLHKHGETDFTIGPIPFGGFVQISGMMLADEGEMSDERAYPNRPVWRAGKGGPLTA